MKHEMIIPLGNDFDEEYGKWDIAPRVVSQPSADMAGYLLAYDPKTTRFLILWDDEIDTIEPVWIYREQFVLLNGVVH